MSYTDVSIMYSDVSHVRMKLLLPESPSPNASIGLMFKAIWVKFLIFCEFFSWFSTDFPDLLFLQICLIWDFFDLQKWYLLDCFSPWKLLGQVPCNFVEFWGSSTIFSNLCLTPGPISTFLGLIYYLCAMVCPLVVLFDLFDVWLCILVPILDHGGLVSYDMWVLALVSFRFSLHCTVVFSLYTCWCFLAFQKLFTFWFSA